MSESFSKVALRWRFAMDSARHGDVLVVAPEGRIGYSVSDRFANALAECVNQGDRRIVVDLAGVDYMSSGGVLALDALDGRLTAVGGTLILCGLSEPVRRVCALAGLTPRVHLAQTRSEALDRLGRETSPEKSAGR